MTKALHKDTKNATALHKDTKNATAAFISDDDTTKLEGTLSFYIKH